MELRVGLGFDAHALEEGVPLVLGGVPFEHPRDRDATEIACSPAAVQPASSYAPLNSQSAQSRARSATDEFRRPCQSLFRTDP